MREQASRLEAHPGAITPGTASGAGLGIVECARGRLVHRVAVAVGRVTDYKILAPTEWNFHPEGPLARGLAGAGVGSGTAIDQAIGLFVTALDPCVGCDLTVEKR
jgi:Ni,Fe-hydrogenase I large subunit